MRHQFLPASAAVVAGAFLLLKAAPAGAGETSGGNLVVSGIPSVTAWSAGEIDAYFFGFDACNLGDASLSWEAVSSDHPVATVNLYRLRNGRFEQIGMSWVAHEYCALQTSLCASCLPADQPCALLGPGCTTTRTAASAGAQVALGPRSEVDPVSGAFVFPPGGAPIVDGLSRRLQVAQQDLDPALNPGALYFAEVQYVSADDATAGNGFDNASHRRVQVGPFVNGVWQLALTGDVEVASPAIEAWQRHGLGLNAPDPDVHIVEVDVPGDGRFLVGAKATDNGDGTWTYEYAVQNLNSARAARAFSVPAPAAAVPGDFGQHLVDHHSGEPYSTAPWTVAFDGGAVSWSTDTFDADPDAHALRWGTLFNFRFIAAAPPTTADATLGLFAPGEASDPVVAVVAPSGARPADLNGDGHVDGADLGLLLGAWGSDAPAADLDGSGEVDGADLGLLLGAWG